MATVSKRQIGIDARRSTASGRFYEIIPGKKFPSVTNILGIVNKPALVPWAAKMEREMVLKAIENLLYKDGKKQSVTLPDDIETFHELLQSLLGKEKAAQKELTKAGEIGTQIHNKIEWMLRTSLGLPVGAEPKISEPAEWGFMAFEDWAKSVNLEPVRIEQVVYSIVYEYAGTMDLLAYVTLKDFGRILALIDFKSGKAIYAESYMQTASYREALIEMGMEKADIGMIVRLPKVITDPEPEPVVVPDMRGNFQGFLAAKQLWQWQQDREQEYKDKKEQIKQAS